MIERLVKDLPEVYQPVFGHPGLPTAASRPCADRLQQIEQIYQALEKLLDRPLKVLDLGCAQGFFSLSLAQRGAQVHGVDYLDKNIALCQALAQENPGLNISFAVGRIEDVVPALQPDQYDLVLGLSVFHHLVHANGAPSVKALLEQLAHVSGALVLEMALQSEPLYWGPSQPADPRELIQNMGFIHLVAHNSTHLAAIPRPLFIVSQHYWVLGDAANRFDNALTDPHAEAHGTHEGSRRYLFGANHVVKQYLLVHATRSVHNQTEYTREVEILRNVPAGFAAAQLLTHGHHDSEAWVAMQRLPGRLLLDLIRDGTPYDSRKILLAVLQQLAALEAAGLYHNDVRTWNVLVDTASEAVHLIDYGSIAPVPKDCVWPGNLFLSFFIFVKEVTTAQVDEPDPLRTIAISPFSLPDPYRSWALSFWQKPMSEWTYEQLQQSLLAWADSDADTTAEPQPMWAWMQAVEEAMQALKEHTQHQCHQLQQQLIEQSEQAQQSKKYAQTQLKDLQAQLLKAQEQTCKELQDVHQSNHHHWQLAEQRQKQIEAMQHSWSWRMSWPVRLAGGLVLHPLTTIRKLINQLLAWSLNTFQTPLTKSMAWVLARPQLTSRINGWLMRWPYLHAHLLGMARQNGVLYPAFNRYAAANQDKNKYGEQSQNLAQLSPRARQIYADLKAAIDQQHKGGH